MREVLTVREVLTRRRTSRRAGSIVWPTVHWTHMLWCVTSVLLLCLTSLCALSWGPADTGAAVSGEGRHTGHTLLNTRHTQLYTVYCTLNDVHCTLNDVHCTLYTVEEATLHRPPQGGWGPAQAAWGASRHPGLQNYLYLIDRTALISTF